MPTIQEQKRSAPLRKSELDSRERGTPSGSKVIPGLKESLEDIRESNIVQVDSELRDIQVEEVEFMEEPVEIIIQKSQEKGFAPKCTDLISINGIKAELQDRATGKWLQVGYLPRGVRIITKRKYVEALVKAHVQSYTTEIDRPVGEDPVNRLNHTVNFTNNVSRLVDNNPKGNEWWARLMASQVAA